MNFPDKETVERIRREYPAGTRARLRKMNDFQAPPAGTEGVVTGVDDAGSILVLWNNGSRLNVIFGADEVLRI